MATALRPQRPATTERTEHNRTAARSLAPIEAKFP
jgi:hypothetical protein